MYMRLASFLHFKFGACYCVHQILLNDLETEKKIEKVRIERSIQQEQSKLEKETKSIYMYKYQL